MSLLLPGYWPRNYWPVNYWDLNYWQHYGTGVYEITFDSVDAYSEPYMVEVYVG